MKSSGLVARATRLPPLGTNVIHVASRAALASSASDLDAIGIAGIFHAAEAAALQAVTDRIRRQPSLSGERLSAPALGFAHRPIAQAERRLVVPPAPRIGGSAVDPFIAQIGMLETDAQELNQVLRHDPDRQPPLVDRLVADVADADREHAKAELVGIEGAERLAEHLAHGIARIRPQDRGGAEAAVAWIEADD